MPDVSESNVSGECMDGNPFQGLDINIDNLNMNNGDQGVHGAAPPAVGPPVVQVADVQQVVAPLVQAIVQGNQNLIQSQEARERSRRFTERVPACDGEEVTGRCMDV